MLYDNQSLEAFLGIDGAITQAELPIAQAAERVGEYAVIYRCYRNKQGGGFGDQSKHPFGWAVIVYVDGVPVRVNSARGDCREWANLDGVSQWLMAHGFRLWWTRNDLEELPTLSPELAAEASLEGV